MLTRQAQRDIVQSLVEIEAVPVELRPSLADHLATWPPDAPKQYMSIIKFAANYCEGDKLLALSNSQLAQIFRCCPTIVSRAKAALAEPKEAPAKMGRPSFLTPDEEAQLRDWICERCARRRWVSVPELKHQVLQVLEDKNVDTFPSRAYFSQLTTRLISQEFDRRAAEVLDSARMEPADRLRLSNFGRETSSSCECMLCDTPINAIIKHQRFPFSVAT